MPGKGEVMDGAMQQAPQPARQESSDWHDMVKVQRRMPTIQKAPRRLLQIDIVPDRARRT